MIVRCDEAFWSKEMVEDSFAAAVKVEHHGKGRGTRNSIKSSFT
jgi:hypothetical protein